MFFKRAVVRQLDNGHVERTIKIRIFPMATGKNMSDMDMAREGVMRRMLPLAVLMLSALALSGQQVEQEFSGKVASVNKDRIVLQSSERGTKEFSVDDKLIKQAGLKDL